LLSLLQELSEILQQDFASNEIKVFLPCRSNQGIINFKPSQKCEQQTFSNNTHSIEFPHKKAVSTFFIPTLKRSNQILMNLEVPETFPLSKTTV